MRAITRFILLSSVLLLLGAADAAEDLGSLTRLTDSLGFMKPIPVSVNGFTGDVNSVLQFDLSFMGFEIVSPEKALFKIQKNNAAGVGALIPQLTPSYNKAFTGGSTRQ